MPGARRAAPLHLRAGPQEQHPGAAREDEGDLLPELRLQAELGDRPLDDLTRVTPETVLVTVFDARTTVGAILFYLKSLVTELQAIVTEVRDRKDKPVDLGTGFGNDAAGALDDLLGGG